MTSQPLPARISPAALEFQAPLDRLLAEPLPRVLRFWPLAASLALLALAALAALLPVDVVVLASGRLAADAPPILLRPMTRAVLTELNVRPGDVVVAGQLLARLDPTLPQADRSALQAERRSIAAQLARLEAELDGRTPPPGTGLETRLQAEVLASRGELAARRRAALEGQVAALTQEIAAARGQTGALQQRADIAREIEDLRATLADRQVGSHLTELEARATRLAIETDLASHRRLLSDLQRQLRAVQDERALFDITERRDLIEALPPLNLRLAQIDDALTKADRLGTLSDLTAPRDAVVVAVAPGGVGAVMAEGEAVITLVPRDADLVAEIHLPTAEVGLVAPGDPVVLKLDAFPWRRSGVAQGRLQSLSPTSFTPEGQTSPQQPARVTDLAPPPGLPPGASLQPGMTLTAEVRTGSRTILDYLLDPLMRGLSESLREP